MSSSLLKTDVQKSSYILDFHHLSSQTWTRPLAVLRWGAALDEQPAKGAAHLAFCQPSWIDTHAADHILEKQNLTCFNSTCTVDVYWLQH